jgi:hypothetical protein
VADRRYYQVALPASDVRTARSVAAEILRRCGEPPVRRDVEGWLSLPTVTAVAAGLSGRGVVEARVDRAAEQIGTLTSAVRDPNLSWYARQPRSRFGSALRVASAHPDDHDPLVTWLALSFDGPSGRERDDQPRVERWLAALAEADFLPAQASPRRLCNTFYAATTLPAGCEPPRDRPPVSECDGVRLRWPAYRAHTGSPQHYGPCDIEVGVSVPPEVAFARAVALWRGGGTVEVSGYFPMDAVAAARWADAGVSRFRLDLAEADAGDVEALLDVIADTDCASVRWSCGWPGGGRCLGGLVLYANAYGGPDDEPVPAPGHATVHLSVHPRVDDRNPDAFAAGLAGLAGVTLVP